MGIHTSQMLKLDPNCLLHIFRMYTASSELAVLPLELSQFSGLHLLSGFTTLILAPSIAVED